MPDTNTIQSFGNLVGGMYARWTLDGVIEIAHAVSADYVARPEFYRGLGVPDNIADLRSSYGYLRNFPNKTQRSELNTPVFGASDGYPPAKNIADKFHQYREPLFKACIAYTERNVIDAASGLKDGVIQTMKYFPQYLRNFEGQSLQSSYVLLVSISDLSYDILKSAVVSGAFGVNPSPTSKWPIETDDQKGSQLISAISDNLLLKDIGLGQEKFTKLRAVAQDGCEALEAILQKDATSELRFETLVRAVYSWAKSIEYYWAADMTKSK